MDQRGGARMRVLDPTYTDPHIITQTTSVHRHESHDEAASSQGVVDVRSPDLVTQRSRNRLCMTGVGGSRLAFLVGRSVAR